MAFVGKQQERTFSGDVTRRVSYDYLLHLPQGYDADATTRWPLVLFLHGRGERGNDLRLVASYGPPMLVEQGRDMPFILVSPQCTLAQGWWQADALGGLLDSVTAQYRVDPSRIYLTGLSMGGYGAWQLGIARPATFAAIVPICGGGEPAEVCAIKDVPVWAFHGDADDVVPLRASVEMVDALKTCGGNVQLTVYPGVKHNSWTQTYADPAMWEWLLAQHKTQEQL